jgi:carbamoyltransferase
MQAFHAITDCPVLVNTSFNVRGEPIVCTPEDAYRCFMATEMDVLVMEDFILLKSQMNVDAEEETRRADYLAEFQLD